MSLESNVSYFTSMPVALVKSSSTPDRCSPTSYRNGPHVVARTLPRCAERQQDHGDRGGKPIRKNVRRIRQAPKKLSIMQPRFKAPPSRSRATSSVSSRLAKQKRTTERIGSAA